VRWIGGGALLALGLVRHLAGERDPGPATASACPDERCCAHDDGAKWAEREERRFQSPRCC
jgi:hypothetical protein